MIMIAPFTIQLQLYCIEILNKEKPSKWPNSN